MPTKRRTPKARRSPAEEAELWGDYFDLGAFLLAGVADQLGVEDDVESAAREAWRRLGSFYLAEGIGRRPGVDRCGSGAWALSEFGEPPCR